jgi:hypothetical protein
VDRTISKTPEVLAVLDRLRADLGPDAFHVVDHWEGDLTAVGVAKPSDHGVLAYIGSFEDGFYVELELPPPPGDDFPYRVAGRHWGQRVEQVVQLVARHLGVRPGSDSRPPG